MEQKIKEMFDESSNEIHFVKTSKGGIKILYKGYTYTVHKNNKGGAIRWRCAQRTLNCKGSVTTTPDHPVVFNSPHNHLPDRTLTGPWIKTEDFYVETKRKRKINTFWERLLTASTLIRFIGCRINRVCCFCSSSRVQETVFLLGKTKFCIYMYILYNWLFCFGKNK